MKHTNNGHASKDEDKGYRTSLLDLVIAIYTQEKLKLTQNNLETSAT